MTKLGKRPAEPWGTGVTSGVFRGQTNGPRVEPGLGGIQPSGVGEGLLGAKVSFQPLGVSCQMSLLG